MTQQEKEALKFYNIDLKDLTNYLSISQGNTKVGKIASFSTLPTYDYIFTKYNKDNIFVNGTCSKDLCKVCEKECYAVKALRYKNTKRAYTLNTLLLRYYLNETFEKLDSFIKKKAIKTFRFNVSGELESYEQLIALNKLALNNKNCNFGIYTKQFDFVKKFLIENGSFSDNLCVNLSQWHNNLKDYESIFKNKVNIFAYDDGWDESLKNVVHCPAVNKQGKSTGVHCDSCNRCYRNHKTITAVYAH